MGQRRDELLERAVILPELRARAEDRPLALKAQGARVYDVDNIGYVDYVGGCGAAIVGYANQFVLDAVRKVLLTGVPDGMSVPQEVDLAESLQRVLPWAGTWWICRNHDEALRAMLRWLRQTTGKEFFLKLDGGARIPSSTLSVHGKADRDGSLIRTVTGWDIDRIEATLTAGASNIAAMIVDPLMTRVGVIPPPEGAVQRIAELCRKAGVLLVLDERISGFRVHRGGAAAWLGVQPDLGLYGGALGGGFPIGVVAFSEGFEPPPVMGELPAPHLVSLAAAEAVLSIVKNDTIYERLEERTGQLVQGVLALAERFSRPMTVNRVGSVFALYMARSPVVDRTTAESADSVAYRRLAKALLGEGVLLPPNSGATAFMSNAHGAKDVEETLAACERVLLRLHQEDLP